MDRAPRSRSSSRQAGNRREPITRPIRVRPTSLTLSCTAKAHVPTRPAARRLLPCVLASAHVRFAADVTPRRSCSAEALQRRIEAGP